MPRLPVVLFILILASAIPPAAAGTLNVIIKAVGPVKVMKKSADLLGFTKPGIKLDQELVAAEKILGLIIKK